MKKRIPVLIMSLFVCLLVGCGSANNSSTASATDSDPTESTESVENTQQDASVEESTTEESEPEIGLVPETEPVDEQEYIEVTGDNVRIRSSVSTETNDNILGMAKKGEKFVKTGDEDDWSKLSYDGRDGFIKTEFVKIISKEEFESTPESIEQTQTETPQDSTAKDNTDALLAKQQQEALLAQQQQEALLAQQQQEALLAQQQQEALLAQQQQQQAAAASYGGGGGTWENTQMRSDRIVYITPTGKKYHYDQECAGPNAIPKNIDDVSGSYGPCKTCVLQ